MRTYISLTIAGYWWYKYMTICVFTIDYKLSRSFILYIYFVIVQEISFIVVDVRVPIWTREEARLPQYEWRLSIQEAQEELAELPIKKRIKSRHVEIPIHNSSRINADDLFKHGSIPL